MNMRVIVLVLVLGIGGLGYVAWQKYSAPAQQEQQAPPQGEMPPQVELPAAGDPGLEWDAPKAWSSEPGRGMRLATYSIAGDKGSAECAVFYFGQGQGGPVDANIQRWLGEFKDAGNPLSLQGRDLDGHAMNWHGMTTAFCLEQCAKRGFTYAGTQYGSFCFCGNSYGKNGPATNCTMPCNGNYKEQCGGEWANTVYRAK